MASRTGLSVPLIEVAKAAEVSVPTVSKVLNGRRDVAAETRERVLAALHSLGEELPTVRRRATGRIDLRVENLQGVWSEEVLRGVVAAAQPARLDVVLSVGSQAEEPHRWVAHALDRGTDGLIAVVGLPSGDDRRRIADAGLPLVLVDPWVAADENCLTVGATNWQGALDATNHLIELGHKRIGTITGSMELKNALARLGGYRSALINSGLDVDESLIRTGDYTASAGFQAAQYFMRLDEPPTAVFAASDDCALGAMRAYREAGRTVPDDVSIVGFDDLPTGRWVEPALTTVRQPLEQMGAVAVDMVVRSRAGARVVPRVELATSLILRGTTAPPSSGL